MSRSFSIPTVLRNVPNRLLRQWFSNHVPGEFDPNWDNLGERDIDAILDYLTDLPASQNTALDTDLKAIFDLASNVGMDAIVETASLQNDHDLPLRIPEDLNLYGRSMWVRLNAPEIHALSASLHEVDSLTYFRKRNDVPAVGNNRPIDVMACDALARAVSTMLKSEGRGQQCSIETLRRDDIDHYFVYADDYVRCDQIHDDNGRLTPHALRPTTQVAFKDHRFDGALEMSADLKKSQKEELERLFASCILGWVLPPYDPQQSYQLNHLKDESFRLTTDPVDQIRVRIEKMAVYNQSTGREHVLTVRKQDPDDSIHEAIQEELNLVRIPLWQAEVKSIVLHFDFLATHTRRRGSSRITVLAPRCCNLRGASTERAEVFQKYLKLWNIDCAAIPKQTPVAVGA